MATDQDLAIAKANLMASIRSAIGVAHDILADCHADLADELDAQSVCYAYFSDFLDDCSATAELIDKSMLSSAKKLLRHILDRSAHIQWIGTDYERMSSCYLDYLNRYIDRLSNAMPILRESDVIDGIECINYAIHIFKTTKRNLKRLGVSPPPKLHKIFEDCGMQREYHLYYQEFSACVHGNFFDEFIFRSLSKCDLGTVLLNTENDRHDAIGLALNLANELFRSSTAMCKIFKLGIDGQLHELKELTKGLERYNRTFRL